MIHKQSYYTVKVHIFHIYCEKSVKTYLFSSLGAEILMPNTQLLKVLIEIKQCFSIFSLCGYNQE